MRRADEMGRGAAVQVANHIPPRAPNQAYLYAGGEVTLGRVRVLRYVHFRSQMVRGLEFAGCKRG